jgi:hypothetical protein
MDLSRLTALAEERVLSTIKSLPGDKALVVDTSLSDALDLIARPDNLAACDVSATFQLVGAH